MPQFLTALKAELIDDARNLWRLASDLVYSSEVAGKVITVPQGFTTDFASVPRLPVAFLLTGDTAHAAAVVHDYLYKDKTVPRRLADRVLLEAMKLSAVPLWRRWGMYSAVRLFGGFCRES